MSLFKRNKKGDPKLAQKVFDYFKFAKVNAGMETDITNRYGIVSLPTVIIFCDGKPTVRGNGTITRQIIEAAIRSSK